jgi:DNA (cytosine-5)-methyltransferase 1
MNDQLRVGALFAGVGGLDLGFHRPDCTVLFNSEIDESARKVLSERFPESELLGDINLIKTIPDLDVLTGGFPCQDISIAGTRAGLAGARSGLVNQVFRLLEKSAKPRIVILENVLNLISLHQGNALRSVLGDFESLGYRWAYRVVDTRGFGLPQRRLRVVIVATLNEIDPSQILFQDAVDSEVDDSVSTLSVAKSFGFYWTEGKRGIGWATDSVPTIKGGSALGIPSPPAVFDVETMTAGTISIGDAERLQGFEYGWTDVPDVGRVGNRWKMVGNAVSVPVSKWLADKILNYKEIEIEPKTKPLPTTGGMPRAAFGGPGLDGAAVEISTFVQYSKPESLHKFLVDPLKPMSEKALRGYLKRVQEGNKIFPLGFVDALQKQLNEIS